MTREDPIYDIDARRGASALTAPNDGQPGSYAIAHRRLPDHMGVRIAASGFDGEMV